MRGGSSHLKLTKNITKKLNGTSLGKPEGTLPWRIVEPCHSIKFQRWYRAVSSSKVDWSGQGSLHIVLQ